VSLDAKSDFHKWLSQDLAKKASVVSRLIRQLCRKNFRYRLTNRSSHPILADIKQSDFPTGGEPRDWRLILVRISEESGNDWRRILDAKTVQITASKERLRARARVELSAAAPETRSWN